MIERAEGETFGKYRLLGTMPSGGMAELFLSVHSSVQGFSKIVVLKRILPHLAESQALVEMFLNEARIAARLDHQNIVRVYESGEFEGRYFMSMEYLPGEDVSRAIRMMRRKRELVPLDVAASIIQQIADGLHFAHELTDFDGRPLGLVHRDVSPSNVFVTYHGAVKLVDFGVAKATNGAAATQTGTFKGKLSYTTPEQVRGEDIDRRSDVFSLGIVFWELLAAEKLFRGESAAHTVEMIRACRIDPPSALRPDVPPELDDIVMRALASEREDRFASAAELSDALDRFLHARARRISPKDLAAWLEGVFGRERAELKRAVSQGQDLAANVPRAMRDLTRREEPSPRPSSHGVPYGSDPGRLSTTGGSRPSGGAGTFARPSENSASGGNFMMRSQVGSLSGVLPSARPPAESPFAPDGFTLARAGSARAPSGVDRPSRPPWRAVIFTAVFVLVEVGTFFAAIAASSPHATPLVLDRSSPTLSVDSQPPGGLVLIDGAPTGLATPVEIRGLRTDRPIMIGVEKAGFVRGEERVKLEAGAETKRSMRLEPAQGLVTFQDVPPRARLIIDGRPAKGLERVALDVGKHDLRLELPTRIVTRTIVVGAGEQSFLFDLDGKSGD